MLVGSVAMRKVLTLTLGAQDDVSAIPTIHGHAQVLGARLFAVQTALLVGDNSCSATNDSCAATNDSCPATNNSCTATNHSCAATNDSCPAS